MYPSCPTREAPEAISPKVVIKTDGTVEPAPGWRWCSYCNGQSVVTTMDGSPGLNESEYECGFCEDGLVEEQ
jgi:hypothetical protein